jgi:hypothetical protein
MPLDELYQCFERGLQVVVVSPADVATEQEGQLTLCRLDVVTLSLQQEGWFLGSCASGTTAAQGWCLLDHMAVWHVHTAYVVDPMVEKSESYLPLEVGAAFLLTRRCDGALQGWAYGQLFVGKNGRQGMFELSNAAPHVLLNREPAP